MHSISRIHQVLQLVPRGALERAVARYQGDRHVKKFKCWDQLVAMSYLQLAGADSLRQLEAGFNPQSNHHYHLATRCVRRTTLSDANKQRDPRIFAEVLQALIEQAGRGIRSQREELLYLMDATTVDLPGRGCEELRGHQSAKGNHGLKLHLLWEAGSMAVTQASITPASVPDIHEGREFDLEAGATYVFDKGYCDYDWWHKIDQKRSRWVTRWKRNAALKVISEQEVEAGHPEILRDSIVVFALSNPRGGKKYSYSGQMRRIEVERPDDVPLVLATNDLTSAPEEIALLYKRRWQIELFFKWVKQHLKIKHFIGHNENAMRIQLLTALIVYMLVLLLKQTTGFTGTLWMLLAELRASLFSRPQTAQAYWRRRQAEQARIADIQPHLFL
jgi:putative transposase